MSGRVPPRVAWAALALALLGALALPATAARDDLDLISRAAGPAGAGADGDSFLPSLSGDGRFVAFTSAGDNLVTEDDKAVPGRLPARHPHRVGGAGQPSRRSGGAATTDDSNDGSVSARRAAGGVLLGRRPSWLRTRTWTRTSTSATSVAGHDDAREPRVRRGAGRRTWLLVLPVDLGRRPARRVRSRARRTSRATTGMTTTDVFVRDTVTGNTDLVSRAGTPSGAAGDADSFAPAGIAADGRYVSFESEADQPLHRGRQDRARHLRARHARRHHDPGEPCDGGQRRRGGRPLPRRLALGRRPLRGLRAPWRTASPPRTTRPCPTSSCVT